jgi:hypothetical protein
MTEPLEPADVTPAEWDAIDNAARLLRNALDNE